MNDFKNSRFRSYIGTPGELEDIPLGDFKRAKLLDGEILIAETENIILYTSLSEPRTYRKGVLTVTNFKLSFIPNDEDEEYLGIQQHYMLKPYEVCLSSVDAVYHISEKTRKKLNLGQSISHKVKELQIVCKNMRILHFSFYRANKDKVKTIINAILHHAAPKRLSLLFAYDYKERLNSPNQYLKDVQWFEKANDWLKELDRTKTNKLKWRVCKVNEYFQVSVNLPQVFIVPASVEDHILCKAAEHFQSHCSPVWVWGTPHNTALIRMADLDPNIQDRTQENIMLEHIRRSHDSLHGPHILDLAKDFPTAKELQTSFIKLRELCNPSSGRLFKQQDNKFYSLLESTRWLHFTRCLQNAVNGARQLTWDNCTVVLQEGSGRDMNCVISSLIQLILDPHWRTIRGFQSLIQKEWVVLGHQFTKRSALLDNDSNEPAPYFLLFLDCTWQLLQQYPTAFQFSETYLTTLWDTIHITIFDTFLFNSEHERKKAKRETKSASFLSAWDYSRQFPESDIHLFCNPLYDDSFSERLYPKHTVPFLEVWRQCYLRWLSGVEIVSGGQPQIDLSCRVLALEINALRQMLLVNGVDTRPKYNQAKEDILHLMQKVNSFFPFSRNDGQGQGFLPGNDLLSLDAQDSQSLLNLTNE
ncbi:Myotubularin-like phosphatase domain [Popillia japonica]|uniref:Myotubularin-like phosphatase domain n=1 Tax=Popillia japonica TaxID=7064 RepID=A0AAW1J0S6_POPJA